MREINLAIAEQPLQESGVVLVEIPAARPGRSMAKDDRREMHFRHSLQLGVGIDFVGDQACDAYVLTNQRAQAVDTKASDHEPQLECAKSTSQRDSVVH